MGGDLLFRAMRARWLYRYEPKMLRPWGIVTLGEEWNVRNRDDSDAGLPAPIGYAIHIGPGLGCPLRFVARCVFLGE